MNSNTEYFSFNDDDRSIRIKRYDTPQPWINYLSNGDFHAFVSQAGGGFAWWQSPVIFRLTRYRQYNLPIDSPGFYIYIRQPDGTVWSPTLRPVEKTLDSWEAKHQAGITSFTAEKDSLQAKLQYFVSPDFNVLVWNLVLTNKKSTALDLDIFAYVELSQLTWNLESQWGYYSKLMLKTWHDKDTDTLDYLYHDDNPRVPEVPLVFLGSSLPSKSFSGSRDHFIGNYRSERNPVAVETGRCGNEEINCGEPAAAVHNHIKLKAGQCQCVNFFLGVVPGGLIDLPKAQTKKREILKQLRQPEAVDTQKEKLIQWWEKHFAVYQCKIPDASAMRQINTWNVVNSVNTGRYSRSINTVAPGIRGIGFRDSCQDMLAIAYRCPEWAEDMLEFLLTQQYEDGHVVHYCYPKENFPPTTSIHSDDHLWLPLLAYAILSETGDMQFLEKQVPYMAKDNVSKACSATLWQHLMSCIRFTEKNLGHYGLPLTLKSDWNDTIGRFNKHGKGQTVFAGQQYVVALRHLIEISEFTGKKETSWLQDCLSHQQHALLEYAWDGKWWRRGFDDNGVPVGSDQADCGKLFLNPQSWAVMSGIGTPDQWKSGMDSVAQQLDTGIGLKILTPSFLSWDEEDKAKTGYGPGCGENGAIFCHANTWAIIAEALLGNAERAWKYFTQLIPINVIDKVGVERYQAEPYAWVSNIVGPDNKRFGWANVEHITGTAPWMDVVSTQYLLGVRPVIKGLLIDPCIPADWKEFQVTRQYRGSTLEIQFKNPHGVCKGVRAIRIADKNMEFNEQAIICPQWLKGEKLVKIEVLMGSSS